MVICGTPEIVKVTIGEEEMDQVSSFRYFGHYITKDMRCTQDIKSELLWANKRFTVGKKTVALQ